MTTTENVPQTSPTMTPTGFPNLAGLPYLNMTVTFDDGTSHEVHADQRDMRRAGAHANPELDPIGYARATAWAYLTRHDMIEGMGWAAFDASVPFCLPIDDPAVPATADPTVTATAD
jgi:hypothetical protein